MVLMTAPPTLCSAISWAMLITFSGVPVPVPPVVVPVPPVVVVMGLITVVSQAFTSVRATPAETVKPSIEAAWTRNSRRGVVCSLGAVSASGKISEVFIVSITILEMKEEARSLEIHNQCVMRLFCNHLICRTVKHCFDGNSFTYFAAHDTFASHHAVLFQRNGEVVDFYHHKVVW